MFEIKQRRTKRILIIALLSVFILLCFAVWFHFRTLVKPPVVTDTTPAMLQVDHPEQDFYTCGRNWLKKNPHGLWEMYIEGAPFERGVINGKLAKNLIDIQEKSFTDQIREMIPSDFYLRFLKYFIYWFNRDLDDYLTEEYKLEIYGISLSASDRFSAIGPNYQRILNYHSAHDIGHALQDYKLVGCSSFGVWDERTADSSLLIGRNFDFYVGDAFAENKIVLFEKPATGHAFMMITWGGMAGTVSGMNELGLTVTINAARSEIPGSARTPISIVAREILQYASTIDEAYTIAKKRETFVSESILVGSANDHKAAIIEKSPSRIALVMPRDNYIVCTNHFQSAEFSEDPLNIRDQRENASVYRYKRIVQDITGSKPLDYNGMASILRDREGLNGEVTGMGNEKAMNQLIAHHSVIFQPERLLVWVSTSPWQCGSYVCYDLYKIFHNFAGLQHKVEITDNDRTILPDPFLKSSDYQDFIRFKKMRKQLKQVLQQGNAKALPGSFIVDFRASNPMCYEVYDLSGDYFASRGEWEQAAGEYHQALSMVIPRWKEKENIVKKLVNARFELKD